MQDDDDELYDDLDDDGVEDDGDDIDDDELDDDDLVDDDDSELDDDEELDSARDCNTCTHSFFDVGVATCAVSHQTIDVDNLPEDCDSYEYDDALDFDDV